MARSQSSSIRVESGLPRERTYVAGSPMAEVLHANLAEIEASNVHACLGLEKRKLEGL